METYEKKYKELEGKIKKAYLYAQTDSTKAVLEEILPELAESEDEKIRKALIEHIKANKWADYVLFQKFSPDDVIAWLEKQESVEEIVERCKKSWYNEGKIDGKFEGIDDDVKYLQGWYDALEKQNEQNPAWSEEDEKMLDYALDMIEWYGGKNEDKSRLVSDWLKSLRPQNRWKPSDEQMDALEHFVRSIGESGYASPYDANLKLVHSLLNDLKKLKEVDKNCKKKGGEE